MSTRTMPGLCFEERYADGTAVDETYGAPVNHLSEAEVEEVRDPDAPDIAYIQLPEPCVTHHCDRCGQALPNEEGEGVVHLARDASPAEVSRAVLAAAWTYRGRLLLCPECSGPSIVSRDAELQRARSAVDLLMQVVRSLPHETSDRAAIDGALDRGGKFLAATEYLGAAFAEDPPRDRQIVMHAALTLDARACEVEDGTLWHDPDMIEALQIKTPGGPGTYVSETEDGFGHVFNLGPTIEVAPVDKRWIRTMSPTVGRALAALLRGEGSAAAVARAILFRPDEMPKPDGGDE
jgi:hypothetical protein